MSSVTKVWVRLPFPSTRDANDICEEFQVTLVQFLDHNPVGDDLFTEGTYYWYVPVEQPGWVDEISLATARAIDKELAIDMPEATWAWRISLIQCQVNAAIQAAIYRKQKEADQSS
jgi:hypothetical protein